MAWFDRFLISGQVRERVGRLELPFNRHGVDPYGTGRDDVARFLSLLGWFYRRYFDVTVHGIEHVPERGRAMLVGNHSGGVALDAAMVIAACFFELEPPRLAQGMAEKFLGAMPFSSYLTARAGHLTGLPEHATRLLDDERLLLVFPEGARGTAKLYGDRNTLVRFGSGFMRLALQTRAPVVPFAFIGGGEAIPTMVNLVRLGRRLGVPYLPVTPWLLPLPRPVPLELYIGEPMTFPGTGNEEDDVVDGWVDQVKSRIAAMIDGGVRRRRQLQEGT
ncbi:MAG TPA: 1-acyl-sn-glycerol-3-phosphate acyltransferase [Kofleriaceae bacterium]|nr:1-acyl-sn-glycerol-3-phosphate acyltransferase [Kofleriaceae bacterium]